jgi:hypothetical protein
MTKIMAAQTTSHQAMARGGGGGRGLGAALIGQALGQERAVNKGYTRL